MHFVAVFVVFTIMVTQSVNSQTYSDHLATAVAFSAGLSRTQHLFQGEKVIFNKIFTNMGGAYSATTGEFTSPQNGLYTFHFHAYNSNKDTAMWVELFKNQDFQVSVSGYNSHSTAGNSIILFLRKGDTVYIKARPHQEFTLFGQPDEIYATFTGYLLQKLGNSNDAPIVG